MATQKPFTRAWGGWLGLLTMIAGLWFLISPGILGFGATNTAGLNAIIIGLLIAGCGALDAFGIGYVPMRAMRLFGLLAAILGLWAIVSPFVLTVDGMARWDAMIACTCRTSVLYSPHPTALVCTLSLRGGVGASVPTPLRPRSAQRQLANDRYRHACPCAAGTAVPKGHP